MKQYIWSILFVISSVSYAQSNHFNNDPSTVWPYLYADFLEATINYIDSAQSAKKLNLNLLNDEMQFLIEDDLLAIAQPDSIKNVEFVNGTQFIYQDKIWYELIFENEVLLLKRYKGDKNDLMESSGAYGTSGSTSSAQKVSAMSGNLGYMYMKDQQQKGAGKSFDLIETLYFYNGEIIKPASAKNLIKLYPDLKNEIKALSKRLNTDYKNILDLEALFHQLFIK